MDAPKSKKEWVRVVNEYSFGFYSKGESSWLGRLPISNGKIRPVPLVLVKLSEVTELKKVLAREKLTLQWSTIDFIPGYHHPQEYGVFALTRPSDDWWNEHELIDGYYKIKKSAL